MSIIDCCICEVDSMSNASLPNGLNTLSWYNVIHLEEPLRRKSAGVLFDYFDEGHFIRPNPNIFLQQGVPREDKSGFRQYCKSSWKLRLR